MNTQRYVQELTNSLAPWGRVLEKLVVAQLVKKLPAVYATRKWIRGFAATGHFSEQVESSPHPHISFKITFNVIFLSVSWDFKRFVSF